MDKTQKFSLSDILIGALLCLSIVLSIFTWNLASEVRSLQSATQQPAVSNMDSSATQVQSAPSVQSQPGIQQRNNGQASTDPFAGLNDPFSNNWPGFMNPGNSFAEMRQRMDELMNSMTQGFPFFNQEDFGFGLISSGPAISMTEDSEAYRVVIAIPEGQEVEVNTDLNDNLLVISGSVKSERDESVSGFNSRSMQESRFSQSLYISDAVDEADMQVERNDSEIIITVPKNRSQL